MTPFLPFLREGGGHCQQRGAGVLGLVHISPDDDPVGTGRNGIMRRGHAFLVVHGLSPHPHTGCDDLQLRIKVFTQQSDLLRGADKTIGTGPGGQPRETQHLLGRGSLDTRCLEDPPHPCSSRR